ncbi:hypothetical protein B9Q00_09895 [Candidatus Marsarchaeota G1 archaeon OSP_C]|uniref:Uncharacterized protein n=1 Tax=Candidatus Marsarchaeota G1 archaeon OSP_C TaxID=1978154 RepID=A0A2R6AKY0_9ARCH|nr:MAG: hypothetical protein B9Q00_09895 [Candidatus Marsarchaeota G1 archaeon OSP_C]
MHTLKSGDPYKPILKLLTTALWLPLVLGWTGSKVVPIDFQSVFVSLGVVLHNTSLITFANTLSTPNNSFVIGAIFIVAFTLITLLGNRVYFAFQTIAFAFMIVAFLITVGVFATNSPVSFSNLIDKTFGAGTYNYMIDEFFKTRRVYPTTVFHRLFERNSFVGRN